MDHNREAYDELYLYTMGRPRFILQHVVDAYGAQTATLDTKPITLIFALVGLYLHVERQFSGTQVQRVHMLLGQRKMLWPTISLPPYRGDLTVSDVMKEPAGTDRDRAIDDWCRSVWETFRDSRMTVLEVLRAHGIT